MKKKAPKIDLSLKLVLIVKFVSYHNYLFLVGMLSDTKMKIKKTKILQI